MSGTRTFINLISVSILFLWSAVLLYFHYSGRVNEYLPGDGIFRPMVLVTGIGLAVIGLFNLLTMGSAVAGCEGHDHGHDHDNDHDHGHSHGKGGGCGHDHHHHDHDHGHGHSHAKSGDCCGGHDHSHGHDHAHAHSHGHGHVHHEGCGHDHSHDHGHGHSHTHTAKGGCCGHDHDHGHGHSHTHDDHHGHGILEESGWTGRLVAILILAAPITWAAFHSPDKFSAYAVMNKGVYDQNYNSTARADEFTLRKDKDTAAKPTRAAPQPVPMPDTPLPPPEKFNDAETVAKASAAPAKEAQSYGSFTLEDLKQQVPQNSKGEFVLEVPEIYYTGGDVEVQKAITGQPIETTAQILPEKVNNDNGHRLRIFRMLVQCCAADARPYSVPVDFGEKAPDLKEMAWVKISGIMSYEKEGDQTIPVIKVTNCEETTAPDNTMIY